MVFIPHEILAPSQDMCVSVLTLCTYTTKDIFSVHFMMTQLICFLFASCDINIIISDANDEWNMIQNTIINYTSYNICWNPVKIAHWKREIVPIPLLFFFIKCERRWTTAKAGNNKIEEKTKQRENLKYVTFIIIFSLWIFNFVFPLFSPFSAHYVCWATPSTHPAFFFLVLNWCVCVCV